MKTQIITKVIIISAILVMAGNRVSSQNAFLFGPDATVPKNDTVVITLQEYEGDIQWQKTLELDGSDNWENIENATADTLMFIADTTTYFRAQVIAGHCDPFYSDTTHVSVYRLKEKVVLIEPDEQQLISSPVELENGLYRFIGETDEIEVGSIIIGSEDEGYMRKVTGMIIVGDTISLETDQATMEDVFDDFYLEDAIVISLDQNRIAMQGARRIPMEVLYLPPGSRFRSSGSGLDFSNTIIYSDGDITVGIEEGSINFEPRIDREFDFSIWPPGLKYARLVASGNIDSDFDFYVESSQPISHAKSILIGGFAVYVPIGPIPVIVTLKFYLGYNADMEAEIYATAGYSSEYEVEFGAEYDRDANPKWQSIWQHDAEFSAHEPTFSAQGELTAKTYVKPELSVTIAGVAGTTLYVDPYVRVMAQFEYPDPYWSWELGAGIGGYLNFKVGLYGYNIVDYTKTLLAWDKVIVVGWDYVDADLPALTTALVTDITPNSATSGGNITSDGGSFVTARGVVWSTTQNPTLSDNEGFTTDGTGMGEFVSNLTGLTPNTTYYGRAYATNSEGTAYGNELDFTTENTSGCGSSVTFTYNGTSVTYGTVVGANDECWLDRNLGASQVATSSNDEDAYGDLFQWGRLDDGHQERTSPTTNTLSNSDDPGHGNFITVASSPFDWRSPQNDNLWQGVNGTNNPCPNGYRVSTEAEWNTERLSWSTNDAAGAFDSPLKLPMAGIRYYISGTVSFEGSSGRYWSSTVGGIHARHLVFYSSDANMNDSYRAPGLSVRCIKD